MIFVEKIIVGVRKEWILWQWKRIQKGEGKLVKEDVEEKKKVDLEDKEEEWRLEKMGVGKKRCHE